MTFLTCQSIQNVPYSRPLSVLLDSGSTTSWFNKNALPPTIRSTTAPSIMGTTMAGEFQSDQLLTLSDVSLSPNYRILSYQHSLPASSLLLAVMT